MSDTRSWGPPSQSAEAPCAKAEGGPALALTPFQPTGPYPQVMLDLPTGDAIPLNPAARGQHIVIEGTLFDGAGKPVFDAMIETWQADSSGHYPHPQDGQATNVDPSFWGYRRVATDGHGRFRIETVKPGAAQGPPSTFAHRAPADREGGPHGSEQAPHLLIAIYGGGVLYRYVTRIYFDDEAANADDPVLALVPAHRRETLMARRDETGPYRFVIRLQGPDETVFFDV